MRAIKLNQFKLWQRFAVLLGLFSIPLLFCFWLLLAEAVKNIEFTEQQIRGLELIKPVTALFDVDTAQDVTTFESKLKEVGVALLNNSFFPNSQKAWIESSKELKGSQVGRSKILLDLLLTITNESNLMMDEHTETFYLGKLVSSEIPLAQSLLLDLRSSDKKQVLVSELQFSSLHSQIHRLQKEGARAKQVVEPLDIVFAKIDTQSVKALNGIDVRVFAQTSESAVVYLEELLAQRLSSIKAKFFNQALMVIVAISGLLISSILALRSITKPLSELVKAARKATDEHDLTHRVELQSCFEIRELSEVFNSLLDTMCGMISNIKEAGAEVTSTSIKISTSGKQQQATTSEIAATTMQIEATSKEIAATSKQLSETMEEVSALSNTTQTMASHGQEHIKMMEQSMNDIVEACGGITTKLATLNERATRINSVVTTITKVADQTNLLSLNAAIEAERAGEAGRGFAVVATEIRRLADQTTLSTADIEQMVKDMQSAVSAGVMGMERFSDEVRRSAATVTSVGGQLESIIDAVRALGPRFETVSEGMQSQTQGASQISDGLTQLSEAARQTASALTESQSITEQLRSTAVTLDQCISEFDLVRR